MLVDKTFIYFPNNSLNIIAKHVTKSCQMICMNECVWMKVAEDIKYYINLPFCKPKCSPQQSSPGWYFELVGLSGAMFTLQMNSCLLWVDSRSLDPAIAGYLSQGMAVHTPLGYFLPLAHLTPRTFLHEITGEVWCIYYIIKFLLHFKETAGVGLSIHCPDLQNVFFGCGIHFCRVISHLHFLSLVVWPILCVHMALFHCRIAVSGSLFVLLGFLHFKETWWTLLFVYL